MREDMAKVIVERPRVGGHWHKKGRDINTDLLPSNEGMKRPYGYNKKELNENLAPLRRFLLRCAGRKWNDVFSEINEHIRPDNLVQKHVLDHIKDYVVIDVHKGEDGKFYEILRWRGMQAIEHTRALMYVNPDTGILVKNNQEKNTLSYYQKERKKLREDEANSHKIVNENFEAHKIEGIWYGYSWDVVPPAIEKEVYQEDGSISIKKIINYRKDLYTHENVSNGKRYRKEKFQLNSTELKRYQLTND